MPKYSGSSSLKRLIRLIINKFEEKLNKTDELSDTDVQSLWQEAELLKFGI